MVYHETLVQRMGLSNINDEFSKNLNGLIAQYGAYGLEQLSILHKSDYFADLFARVVSRPG
jgi:hypothetical protein